MWLHDIVLPLGSLNAVRSENRSYIGRFALLRLRTKRIQQCPLICKSNKNRINPFFADQEKHNFLVCFCFLLQINAQTGRYAVCAERDALTGRYTVKAEFAQAGRYTACAYA